MLVYLFSVEFVSSRHFHRFYYKVKSFTDSLLFNIL